MIHGGYVCTREDRSTQPDQSEYNISKRGSHYMGDRLFRDTGIASFPVIILYASIRSPLVLLFSKFVNPHLINLSSYVNFPSPLIILVALLCTCSNVSMSCLKYGLQACTQYSRCGLTSDLNNLSTTSCSLLTIVLLFIPSILFALFAASTHCLDGFALLYIITPRSLSSSEALKATPPMSYLNFLLPLPMCSTEHLSTLKSICQSLAHSYNLLRSSLITDASSSVTASLHSFVSSANFDIFESIPLSMSLMKIIKRSGPNTDPCGTPLLTPIHSENAPLIPTLCLLSFSQFSIHLSRFPPNPQASIFFPSLM